MKTILEPWNLVDFGEYFGADIEDPLKGIGSIIEVDLGRITGDHDALLSPS